MDVPTLIENVGKVKGHFKTKSNRAAKLIEIWDDLESKFVSMVERGQGQTETARLAYALLLMMETGIRTGNESSAEGWKCVNQIVCRKDNPAKNLKIGDIIWRHPEYGKMVSTYGLTTLLNEHIKGRGKVLKINFIGKKLVDQDLTVRHPTLLKHRPKGKPKELWLGIDYYSLKKFVKKYVGKGYTPKDLRMAKVNILFISKFGVDPYKSDFASCTTKGGRKKILASAIEETANIVGHTKSVCRSAYLSAPLLSYILTQEN
jgi:DNA topoisomerase IB